MFRLGVVSDSHNAGAMVERVCPLLAGMDAVAHLGDGMGDAGRITGLPVHAVAGNCDLLTEYPRERTEVFAGTKVLLTHGDLYRVKHSLMRLSLRAREAEALLALYGHTHAPSAEWVGGALLVNPGALMDGRYAIIEFRENGPAPFLLHV